MGRTPTSSQVRFTFGLAALFLVTTWACLLVAAIAPELVLGWRPLALTSNSMAPGLRSGDVVSLAPQSGDVGPGTVVAYRTPDGLVTHRVVAMTPEGDYITKGDSNRRPDSTPVEPYQVEGVGRIRIPMLGLPLTWLWSEDWVKFSLWTVAAAAALWCCRWGLLDRYAPQANPRARRGIRLGYRGRHRASGVAAAGSESGALATVALLLGVAVLAVLASPASAAFTSVTSNESNQLAAASSFGFVGYLHNNPTPPVGDTSSQIPLPMSETAPSATTLYNYDDDRDSSPGLLLGKSSGLSETDPTKHQIWSMSVSSDLTLSGPSSLVVWSAIKDFDTSKRGVIQAAVLDCDSGGGNCTTLATGTRDVDPWSGGSSTWVERTVDLGTISHTVVAGRTLRVKLVVDGNSGDDMWFAYDTTSYPSTLSIGP